jgi:hypothetical protein
MLKLPYTMVDKIDIQWGDKIWMGTHDNMLNEPT